MGVDMTWNARRFWSAIEPAQPIILLLVIMAAVELFHVHGTAVAVLAGLGIVLVQLSIYLLVGSRSQPDFQRPLLHPRLVPWGAGLVLGGGLMTLLPEPWKYEGFGILFLGLAYIVVGAAVVFWKSPLSAR